MPKTFQKCGETGGGIPRLAPDLTYPADKTGSGNFKTITGIDASSGLTTALSLSGKFEVSYIAFTGQIAEVNTYKLTVDGVVIWNDTHMATVTTDVFLGGINLASDLYSVDSIITCQTSFLLEVQTATDTNIGLQFLARAIL